MSEGASNPSDKEVLRGGKKGDPPSSGVDGEWDWVKKIGHCSEWLGGCSRFDKGVRPSVCLPPLL